MIFRKITPLLLLLSLFMAMGNAQAQPTITTMTLQGVNPTNDVTLNWSITFDRPVSGVTTTNFTLVPTGVTATLGSVQATPDPAAAFSTTWIITATGVSGDGTLGLDLSNPAGIVDQNGMPLSQTITGPLYEVDNTSPMVVSITRLDPSPTSAPSVDFLITFSEAVFSVSEINFAPNASGTAGTVESVTNIDNVTWTATISGITGAGTIQLDLNDTSNITDAAGNFLFSDFTTGEQYVIDRQGPQYVCITRLDPNPTSASLVRFMVEFDEPTSNVQTTNFTIDATGTTGTITSVTTAGDGTTWTLIVDNIQGQGQLTVDLTDPAGIIDSFGNPTTSTGNGCEAYDIDRVNPEVVSIDLPSDSPTSGPMVQFVVTFSEPVTSGTLADFSLVASGDTTGTISAVTTLGDTTTVTVTGISGHGMLCLRVESPSTITDLLGNPLINIPVTSGCYIICEDLGEVLESVPEDGETTVTTAPLIEWIPPQPDQLYHVYFDGNFIGSTTDTQIGMPQPLTPGQHRYMIDIDGSCTSGTEVVFNVLDFPILVFPIEGFESCLPPTAFSWEPVDGATTYTLFVDGILEATTTSTQAELSGSSFAIGSHTWFVIAASEFTQQQSEVRTFTVLAEDRNPPVVYTTNGTIHDIEVVGATTYIVGEFTQVKVGSTWHPRNNIASLDTGTSTVQTWAPDVNGAVYTVHATASRLLIGGNFTRINNTPIARIGSVDIATTAAASFHGANGPVRAIETVGTKVYFGGDFTRVNSQVFTFADRGDEAIRLATADLGTTTPATSTVLNPNASVRDLLFDGTHMYVAGVFSEIGGQPHHGLTRLDPATSVVDPDFISSPSQLPVDLYVYTMHKVGNALYIGGSFNQVLGESRPNAAALTVGDAGTSTTLLPWNPRPNSAVHSIDSIANGSTVFIGGTFTTLNNARHTYLVAVDPVFGNPMTCAYNTDRLIYAVEALPGGQIVGGGQATISGRTPPAP